MLVTWSTGWRSGAATYGMMLMTTKASLFLPGREMRTKKWPTTMTVAVAMVDGDDDDGDSAFLWRYMLYADEHVVVVVCREAD